jgi:hypothetical protein
MFAIGDGSFFSRFLLFPSIPICCGFSLVIKESRSEWTEIECKKYKDISKIWNKDKKAQHC